MEEGSDGRDFGLRLGGMTRVVDLGGIYSWEETCDVQQKCLGSNSP